MSTVTVELLLIPDCPNEEAAQTLIHTALTDVHLPDAPLVKTVIADEADAARRGFVGSPTILINGSDPFARQGFPGVACRIYSTPDGPQGVPALRDLRQALKEAAASEQVLAQPAQRPSEQRMAM